MCFNCRLSLGFVVCKYSAALKALPNPPSANDSQVGVSSSTLLVGVQNKISYWSQPQVCQLVCCAIHNPPLFSQHQKYVFWLVKAKTSAGSKGVEGAKVSSRQKIDQSRDRRPYPTCSLKKTGLCNWCLLMQSFLFWIIVLMYERNMALSSYLAILPL